MKILMKILMIFIILFCIGCSSTKHIQVSSMHLPKQTNVLQNIETEIKCWFTYTHYYEKSKESIYQNHLDSNRLNIISAKKLDSIILNIYVSNPRKIKYELFKIVKFKETNSQMNDFIYKGNDKEKVFQLIFPKIKDIPIDCSGTILVDNFPIIFLGNLKYKICS